MRTIVMMKYAEIMKTWSLGVEGILRNCLVGFVFRIGGTTRYPLMMVWNFVMVFERSTVELVKYWKRLFSIPKNTTMPQKPIKA